MFRRHATSRHHVAARIDPIRSLRFTDPPHRGWIRAIRDGLGMTGVQLAKRMGVSQPTVSDFEKGEVARTVTLETLDRAAHALGCRVVYALVPEQDLEISVRKRALAVAGEQVKRISQTMRLEDQQLDPGAEARQIERLAAKLVDESPSLLWNEP